MPNTDAIEQRGVRFKFNRTRDAHRVDAVKQGGRQHKGRKFEVASAVDIASAAEVGGERSQAVALQPLRGFNSNSNK
ncbi:hypothetical protein EMPG_10188 [Blastomyces silverae]|uniref:Uncharacterized protein n=1 Tax=Blastomyces silverae TaxID=2060906 RepID=A0A0H1B5Z0_9EURO|nr:hypothetical protein EMPG_10188 [Blastomyces silverae]